MKEKYREGYCPGCYFMGRDIVRRAIVQGAIIREGNRPGGQLSVPRRKDHLKTLWEKNNLIPFSTMFSFQPRRNILLSANAYGFGQFKNLLFSKELMTRTKKKKTLWEKNSLITGNTLFNNVSHPIKDIDLYSVLCKKKKM